MLDCRWRS